jgi:hypothetical protein
LSSSNVKFRGGLRRVRLFAVTAGCVGVLALMGASAPGADEPATAGGPTTMRRLDEAQYRRAIRDVFGPDIAIPGRFDPPRREDGLLAIGDARVTVSSSGFEQFELRAREISAQALAPERRDVLMPCKPRARDFDRECAGAFLRKYGLRLYRRPLSPAELKSVTTLSAAAAEQTGDFYKGLQAGLAHMLASPNFIFRVEHGVPDPQRPGGELLDDYSLASRISFLLWDAPPDEALLQAATSGALRQPAALDAQVDRLIDSPRFKDGVRAFFSDMFAYERFDGLSKDQAIYPKFTSQLAKDAEEQTLKTVVDLLVVQRGDYRDLFTTKKTFMNRNLAALYRVPVEGDAVQGWTPYTFGPNDPRAGLLSLAGFLMLDPTHEGRSSPTIRGKSVRELLLCQPVPPPPPNVNFSIVQDTSNPQFKTARERLQAHRNDPSCAGCHAITDPVGLSMENYDAVGAYRTSENGAPIDASGAFESKPYVDVIGLERILHDSPAIPACVVQRAYEYGVGRAASASDTAWLNYAQARFAGQNYQFPALMRLIATSRAFQQVARPAAKQQIASLR